MDTNLVSYLSLRTMIGVQVQQALKSLRTMIGVQVQQAFKKSTQTTYS
jgi:hypothetical protein